VCSSDLYQWVNTLPQVAQAPPAKGPVIQGITANLPFSSVTRTLQQKTPRGTIYLDVYRAFNPAQKVKVAKFSDGKRINSWGTDGYGKLAVRKIIR